MANRKSKIATGFLIFFVLAGLFLFFNIPSKRPNIILITMDALRADHLGCYGYPRNTSPNIDKFAKEATVFLNCFSTGSETPSSFVGLFTGRYLGLRGGYLLLANILDKKFTTLAEYCKDMGYFTAAFVTSPLLKIRKGFGQGFDYYYYLENGNIKEINKNLSEFLGSYKRRKPFFIWIHCMESHVPYSSDEEYFKIFRNDNLYRKNDKILDLNGNVVYKPFKSRGYIPQAAFSEGRYNLNYYIASYDAAIRYADFYIGELLKEIKDDNTMILLTADHGESLGEHNVYFHHGENIYDEVLRVPLIIKDNGYFKGGARISTAISSVDIVPTILSRINPAWYFFNKNKFDGRDLEGAATGQKDIKRDYIYSYSPSAKSIRDINKNIKYILNEDGKEEMYLLPDEYTNHIDDKSPEAIHAKKELRRSMKRWLKDYPVYADINAKEIIFNERDKEKLRALGYLR